MTHRELMQVDTSIDYPLEYELLIIDIAKNSLF